MASSRRTRQRREAMIRKIQATLNTERDLAEHIHDRQLVPFVRAAELRAELGIDVGLEMVNVAPGAEGVEVSCGGCGRTARLPNAPPAGSTLLCPDCQESAP